MTELVIYRGLPASGKTTAAKAWVAQDPAGRARVNRDDLRAMLHDSVHLGHATEARVRVARDRMIRGLLDQGVSVASDDTNLSQKTARNLAKLGRFSGADVRVVDLTDVPVSLCTARDYERLQRGERAVGEDVIREMHGRYLAGKPRPLPLPVDAIEESGIVPYVPRAGAPLAIMVDLDGTLCLHNGRSPYDESLVGTDLPNPAVVATVRAWGERATVLYCSGRSRGCFAETLAWIEHHVGVVGPLFMRPVGDTRKDAVVKREIFDAHIRDNFDVVLVLDDRQQVVDAWREIGLTVFQVAPGDF